MNKKNYLYRGITFVLICTVLISLDQVTKYMAVNALSNNNVDIIRDFFSFELVHNYGAAFGILQNKRVFFCILTIIFCIVMEYIYFKLPQKGYIPAKAVVIGIFCGACGNLIDRIHNGYVVDFIAFDFGSYSFPRFNMADIYITISSFAAIILLLFVYDIEKGEHDGK